MYERLIKSMRSFLKQRESDGIATNNGNLPTKQQKKMDSIISQIMKIGKEKYFNIARNQCNTIAELTEESVELEKRIKFLDEGQHHLNTIIEERDIQIQQLALMNNPLQEQITELKKDVAHEKYEHYVTCESEGLNWGGDIPEEPEGY